MDKSLRKVKLVEPKEVQYPAGYIPARRRMSVSAESLGVGEKSEGNAEELEDVPKTPRTRQRLCTAIKNNVLFRHLNQGGLDGCVDVMFERKCDKGEVIIEQGDLEADNFYVIDSGQVEILVSGTHVGSLGPSRSFGEIALMYNTPRNATVRTTSSCSLWAMGRLAFRTKLMEHSIAKRRMHENFLASVPILSNLTSWERSVIADALQTCAYAEGTDIVKQGDPGDFFFIIEEGECEVTVANENNKTVSEKNLVVGRLNRGDFFGEMALLHDCPRIATVTAVCGPVTCLMLNRNDFYLLMGPCDDILKRHAIKYSKSCEDLHRKTLEPSLSVPEELPHVLTDLTREILRHQPDNIPDFAARFFEEKLHTS